MTTMTSPQLIFPTIDLPCPSWCQMPAGHGWDSVTAAGRASRIHEKQYSDRTSPHYVAVTAEETAPAVECCDTSGCHHAENITTTGPATTAMAAVSVDVATRDGLEPDEALILANLIRKAGEDARQYRRPSLWASRCSCGWSYGAPTYVAAQDAATAHSCPDPSTTVSYRDEDA